MRERQYILALFLLEILIYAAEIVVAVLNKKNKILNDAKSLEGIDFINLSEGYRTSISFFRISIFISYIILVFISMDTSRNNFAEKLFMVCIIGFLVYLVSLYNVKTFIFYVDYFIVAAPFSFFQKDIIINYQAIRNFQLYSALFNLYTLKIELKNGKTRNIFFSGSLNPRNDLVIKLIISSRRTENDDNQPVRSWQAP